ncbi:hypothetical protein [Neisseria iguanae]|uniref:hypothetical protein n=1 Tax=Neisseria iguanae TaxID=90242 RepID=UPI001FEB12F9|nr:hypothetical protein [Neisseria iguanae]
MNALSSNFFLLSFRTSGNSRMQGIGRISAIISTFAGTRMLNAGWNFPTMALTVPALLISVSLAIKYFLYRNQPKCRSLNALE